MITPTIGRVVLFQPMKNADQPFREQPYPGLICHVHTDTCINVAYFREDGTPDSATSVTLLQEGDDRDSLTGGRFAEWMPYQVAQAKAQDAPA